VKALHGIGAGLGDPLHISLSDGRVLVAGVGVAAGRQREIQTALDGLPRVAVEFSDPASSALPLDTATPAPSAVSDATGPFEARLETQLGGRGGVDRLAGRILSWGETLMAHAFALRSLAEQFPDEAALSEADRASLHAMVFDHISAMGAPAANFDSSLTPVLTGLGATAQTRRTPADSAWQGSAEHVFQAAGRVEMLSSLLLGVARGEKANADLPSELLGAVSDLRSHLEQNQRLLGR